MPKCYGWSRDGADQFAAGRSLPRDDADRQRDGSGEADGCDAAGRKPVAARLPGAAENGAVRDGAAPAWCRRRPQRRSIWKWSAPLSGSNASPRPPKRSAAAAPATLRIAALPALSNGYLPRLAGGFLKERPNLNLSFFGVISPIVIDWVLNNQCDIGFAEVPIAHSGLPSVRLPALPRVAVLPDRPSPCGQGKCWNRAISRARPSSRCRRDRRSRHLVDQAFNRDDVRRVLRVETSLSEIMCGMVSSGLGRGDLRSLHGAGIREPRRRRAPFPAADRFRILPPFFPRSAAPHRWLWTWSRPCDSRSRSSIASR